MCLYQTPTHFLLELIQNADDNNYTSGVIASLRLSLYEKDGQKCLRTDCNEVGFTFKQLDALTRVGQSTKKSTAGGRKGYIGEKGIGFKSVFKVADVVHIASGFYEFKLNRNNPIGMILPILSPFPTAERVADHTQFLLRLKDIDDYKEIRRDLEDIEPQLLLFLRKLKEIHVSTPGVGNVYRLRATEYDEDFGGETATISECSDDGVVVKTTKYVVHRHIVRDLPAEPRREGVTTSEVVVAFAVRDQVTPVATTQAAFAFLPIDNFGFRARDEDAPFREPGALRYVPKEYRFEDGTLFDLPSINASHLSFAYDSVRENLSLIGVTTLTLEELCDEFKVWIDEVGVAGIEEQSTQWHRQVSSLFYDVPRLKEKLQDFPIIPIRDGSWVNAGEKHVYLASNNGDEHVPTGVDISIVDQDASRDRVRRKFFNFLGIEEYSPRQVCDLILELHEDLLARRTGRAIKELVADAAYLFKHRSQLKRDGAPAIFFAVMKDGKPVMSRFKQTYLIDPRVKPGLIAKYRNTPGNPFSVLSDEYETAICDEGTEGTAKEFREWLLRSENSLFATIPILVHGTKLSPEWNFLRDQDVVDLLYVVKFYCKMYNPPLKLLKAVPELEVYCLDGVARALGLLAVPTADLKQHCPHLDFAKLPEPTLENWGFLSKFGVITTCDTTARLRELQALSELPVDDVDKKAVHEIYRALSSSMSLNKEEIQTAFSKRPLVFVNKPKPKWLSHEACVWTAHALLKQVIKLKTHYRDCKNLFRSFLGVESAGTKHVVDEFCSTSDDDDETAQRFEKLFSLLGDFHSSKSSLSDEQIERVQSAPVFPILEKGDGSQEESGIALRSMDDMDWYIPDSATLETAFRGKVDMLSLPVKSVRMLRGLFEDLDCKNMFLSSAVETVEPSGTCIRDRLGEDNLKTRLRYISQCLGDVKVTNDNEVIMIKETEEITDIYLREGIQESDQSAVNFELLKHFISEFEIDGEDANLANHLMSAPISRIPEIMEKHDIFSPEDPDDEGTDSEGTDSEDDDTTAVDRTDEPSDDELNIELGEDDEDEGGYERLKVASKATDSDVESESFSTFAPTHPHRPQSLRELIPSHQSRAESIVRKASHFRMSDSLVAITPIQHHRPEGAFRQSLLIRTRSAHDGGEGGSSPGWLTSTATSRGNLSDRYNSEFFDSDSSGYQASPRARDGPVPASEIRRREIGFLGELFVYEMFERQIDDWTFESWTSDMRGDAGHPRFEGCQGDFADFTYLDRSGHMREALREAGVEPNAEWSNDTKFHLEVKATLGHCAEAFFVSQNQLDKMREFDGDPNNAYVLLRVFNLEEDSDPGIKLFRDPWSLYMDGILDFRSEQGYKVYGGEATRS
ncbi:hypothetical protein DL762_000845 [Monosporascus cannonballus]|uniref:Protein NO VEIN C-terminal domain-containing protein n=1 Tax=Monosporascus cannonballus TaxID=155416 RepID=A0ABY0HI03_9PEZI|nr:hypothetical protein DL762_000845 [Monosporascus cannonballus]